jgi:glycine amidinotransferase
MTNVVCSYNEWDPLEEVIVGTARGAVRPAFEPALAPYAARHSGDRLFTGAPFPEDEIARAERQLDGFAALLEREGIVVRRPEPIDHRVAFRTPDFEVPMGHAQACPRDVLLVIGDEIIEAPMAARARFFEYRAYRPLVKRYFRLGARWMTAPKPSMGGELYNADYSTEDGSFDLSTHSNLTEHEPCFDAACFSRFGRDIFWQPDVVSNQFGADWLQRHLGSGFRIHRVEFRDRCPEHIDATLVPVRPGLVLVNPARPFRDGTAELFEANGWRVVPAVPSVRTGPPAASSVSNWISLNIFSLDEKTAVVEEAEVPLMDLLKDLGCQVIPCPFDAVFRFGGSFHCCTVDIRRRGGLESYFPTLDG